MFIVFAQAESGQLPPASLVERLTRAASQYFGARLEPFRAAAFTPSATDDPSATTFSYESQGYHATFLLRSRLATPEDVTLARGAEARGRAGGMADLAARCSHAWLLEPHPGTAPWLVLECAGVLASVGLGPILPPTHETLLGVRSARERSEKLRKSAESAGH